MSDSTEEEQKALKVLNDAREQGRKEAWHDVFTMAARELDFGGTTEDQLRSKLAHLQQERGYAIAALRGRVLSEDAPPGHYSSEHPGVLEVID